jgi:glycosyltransferase involved in cell wall biosynthesis
VIPNATRRAPSDAPPARQPERDEEDQAPFLLAVGHLSPRKGLEIVFEALARAAPRLPPRMRLALVGQGGEEAALRVLAARLAIEPRLLFCGPIPDAQLGLLYRSAQALLFPSRFEGFGFPVFEALDHGCPVIAARLPPLEALTREAIGVSLLERDASVWAEAIVAHANATPRLPARSPDPGTTWQESAWALARLYEEVSRA